jgi:hypothetical protein
MAGSGLLYGDAEFFGFGSLIFAQWRGIMGTFEVCNNLRLLDKHKPMRNLRLGFSLGTYCSTSFHYLQIKSNNRDLSIK